MRREFKSRGTGSWVYRVTFNEVVTDIYFDLQGYGQIRELMMRGKEIVYNREYTVGDKLEWTWKDYLENECRPTKETG